MNFWGKSVGGWKIQKFINHGKSAVVFLAEKDGGQAALKVFEPEIVDRFGWDSQLKRIERERSLIGKIQPNLVSSYDGGDDSGLLGASRQFRARSSNRPRRTHSERRPLCLPLE